MPWYLQPVWLASYAWYMAKWQLSLRLARRRSLDALQLQQAAVLYAEDGEISGGKFRELAVMWALGEDISGEVEKLVREVRRDRLS